MSMFKSDICQCQVSTAYVDPWDMLNNFCFHVYAQKWHMSSVKCQNAYVDPRDMLNIFCFHVYAQMLLFMDEKCNAFFG